MSTLEMNSHVSLLRNHEATHRLLHNNLRLLHNNLRLHHLLWLHDNLRLHHWLLLNNDNGLLLFGANIGDLFLMEDRSHHKVTSGSALEHQGNALVNGSTLGKHSKGNVSVSKGFTLQHILIADFNMDVFVELVKLLDWNFHVLPLPLRVFATIMANS